MQLLSFVAALGVAIVGMVGCGGSIRAPIEPVSAAVSALTGVPITAPSVVTSPLGPPLLAGPIVLQPQHVSAHVPPPLPSYKGVWSGQSIRRACIEVGGAVGVACRALPERNWLRLEVTQIGSEVRALLTLGGQRAVLTGRVRPDGTLTLRGKGGSATHTITVSEWQATMNQTEIHGTFSYVIAADDERLGSVAVTAEVDGLPSVS